MPATRKTTGQSVQFRLLVGEGTAATVFPLILKETLVGRIDSAHLVLEDRSVSRLHARLTLRDDGVYIEDLQSKEGTWVNGRAVSAALRLENGDVVAFGEVMATFTT